MTPTPTLISALRILARDIQSGDGVANAAIAEAADRMEEMETREKNLSQKICCFTGESLEDAADRLREEHNKAKMESDAWKERATRRMGLMHDLRKEMGIEENMENDAELKAALTFVREMKKENEKLREFAETMFTLSDWLPDHLDIIETVQGAASDVLTKSTEKPLDIGRQCPHAHQVSVSYRCCSTTECSDCSETLRRSDLEEEMYADDLYELERENQKLREENSRLREDRDYQYNLNMEKEKSRRSSRPALDQFYP